MFRLLALLYLICIACFFPANALSESEDPLLAKARTLEANLADNHSSSDTQLNLARAYFFLSVDDAKYIDRAESEFTKTEAQGKRSSLTQMYLATIQALRADNEFWPLRAKKMIDEALEKIESAYELSPQDFEIRFLRASTWFNLPAFFGKHDASKAELQKLGKSFDRDTVSYPDFVRAVWADFLVDRKITSDPDQWQELRNLIR